MLLLLFALYLETKLFQAVSPQTPHFYSAALKRYFAFFYYTVGSFVFYVHGYISYNKYSCEKISFHRAPCNAVKNQVYDSITQAAIVYNIASVY